MSYHSKIAYLGKHSLFICPPAAVDGGLETFQIPALLSFQIFESPIPSSGIKFSGTPLEKMNMLKTSLYGVYMHLYFFTRTLALKFFRVIFVEDLLFATQFFICRRRLDDERSQETDRKTLSDFSFSMLI